MIHNILANVLCKVFEEKVGKNQAYKESPKAFHLNFSVPVDYEKEEGYRHLELLIYAPMNYVGVYVRETWNVIPTLDLEWDEEAQDYYIAPGKGYVEGASEWTCLGYHDSGWREAVRNFIHKNQDRLQTLGIGDPWEIIDPPKEVFGGLG